jgi:hypothetical protein
MWTIAYSLTELQRISSHSGLTSDSVIFGNSCQIGVTRTFIAGKGWHSSGGWLQAEPKVKREMRESFTKRRKTLEFLLDMAHPPDSKGSPPRALSKLA